MAVVVETRNEDSDYHKRIRVMWVGKIPLQAKVLSTNGGRITTWLKPKHFEVLSEAHEEAHYEYK